MTIEEMNNEIRDYCLRLIFESDIADWQVSKYNSRILIKNNIIIRVNPKGNPYAFTATIYTDNTFSNQNKEIQFEGFSIPRCPKLFARNKKRYEEKEKLEEIKEKLNKHFDNIQLYKSTLETYNLLPIKELRKKKLQNLNGEND